MSITIVAGKFRLFAVLWPVYDPYMDRMVERCFRVRWQ